MAANAIALSEQTKVSNAFSKTYWRKNDPSIGDFRLGHTISIVQTVVIAIVNVSIIRGPSSMECAARRGKTVRMVVAIKLCVDVCGAGIFVDSSLSVGMAYGCIVDGDATNVYMLQGNV